MRHTSRRVLSMASMLGVAMAIPAIATAQQPTVDPTPEPTPRPEPGAPSGDLPREAPPTVITPRRAGQAPPTGVGEAAGEDEAVDGNLYLEDYLEDDYAYDAGAEYRGGVRVHGPAPATHVVRAGDTLWDICGTYFNNPWEWPRIWSYNPQITNPHWIYPGNVIRLREEAPEQPAVAAEEPEDGGEEPAARPVEPRRRFALKQLAFLGAEELEEAIRIDGSPHEKMLLAEGDDAYLAYDEIVPEVGKTYAVFREKKQVRHPESGEVIGSYVEIVGMLEVESVPRGKRARAHLIDSTDAIERGHFVGVIPTTFQDVEPVPNDRNLEGLIVAQLEAEELIGARQAVFIDRGKAHGVEIGNRMFVVRSGDAYQRVMKPGSNVGQDDDRFPARAVGQVLIVQVAEKSSLALVTLSLLEFGVGDRVLMRRAGAE